MKQMFIWHHFEGTEDIPLPLQNERMSGKSVWAHDSIQNASGVNGGCIDFREFRLCPMMKGARSYSKETILSIDFSTEKYKDSAGGTFFALLSSCLCLEGMLH